jgi:hypothetical protein
VPSADAFVAITTADFVDAFEAADEQPLQVQLRRDPQKEREIERVVMGAEGTCRRATHQRVQRRRLHLEEAVAIQKITQPLHDQSARTDDRGGRRVRDEVDVAVAIAEVGVGHAVPLVGQRPERLREHAQLAELERKLPGLRDHRAPSRLDVIGDVELVERDERLAHRVLLGEELNFAAAVAEPEEAGLAEAAPRDDAAEHVMNRTGAEAGHSFGVVTQLGDRLEQRGSVRRAQLRDERAIARVGIVGKRVQATCAQLFELGAARFY